MTLSSVVAAEGCVVGREHRRVGRDGQDGHASRVGPRAAVAVVTDGCSSGASSEVGARLFAAVVSQLAYDHVLEALDGPDGTLDPEALARGVTADLVARLDVVLGVLVPCGEGGDGRDAAGARAAARAIERFLLFGFLVAVVAGETAFVFGVGDGVIVTEDEVVVIDPGPENAPPYAAYALLTPDAVGSAPLPRVHVVRPGRTMAWIAVATDGLAALPEASLLALASDARLAKNPSLLGKRLRVLAEAGTFHDDATMAVLTRRSP
jgi:hypothetical protein